jgi:hypothetical protein
MGNLPSKLKLEQEEMKRNEIGRKKVFCNFGRWTFCLFNLAFLKGSSQPASQKKKKLYNKNYAMGTVDRQ